MRSEIKSERVYVLRKRAHGERAQLLELFSLRVGRVSAGVRSSKLAAALEPFQAVAVSGTDVDMYWQLSDVEALGAFRRLSREALLAALRINELVLDHLPRGAPCPPLFTAYERALDLLIGGELGLALRSFEYALLVEIGCIDDEALGVDGPATWHFAADGSLVPGAGTHSLAGADLQRWRAPVAGTGMAKDLHATALAERLRAEDGGRVSALRELWRPRLSPSSTAR